MKYVILLIPALWLLAWFLVFFICGFVVKLLFFFINTEKLEEIVFSLAGEMLSASFGLFGHRLITNEPVGDEWTNSREE